MAVKIFSINTMKNMGMYSYTLMFEFGATWQSSELHAPSALSVMKVFPVPKEQKVEWAPELVWMLWKRHKLFPLESDHDSRIVHSVA